MGAIYGGRTRDKSKWRQLILSFVIALVLSTIYCQWDWNIHGCVWNQFNCSIREVSQIVEHARTIPEKADALHDWMHLRARSPFWMDDYPWLHDWISEGARASCGPFSETYSRLANILGIKARPVFTFWPTIGNSHYWVEIWDNNNMRWHPMDVSSRERSWDSSWILRVPKAVTLVPTDRPGSWDARLRGDFDCLENTIGLSYPSGVVEVEVRDKEQVVAGERITIYVWLGNGMGGDNEDGYKFNRARIFKVLNSTTRSDGCASFTLGASAEQPYLVCLDSPDSGVWAWIWVVEGKKERMVLRKENFKTFVLDRTPPVKPRN